ncbi:hypothetical protein NDU88_003758 [Pleurodeles waltl]|uniref:Nuclease HARBI1 n=1 Tax=Pleurodeles waltl TaxID=8319 RepID=A0AAV7QCN2_PLEWA|nr:hypothetical protein NDU88_003758 [Pleurodeles waltl]
MVMGVVDEEIVHAGVSRDATGRVVEDEEEGDTVEAVDIGVSASGWCLCKCLWDQVEDLATVKADFYAMGHIPNIIGAIDGTHIAFVPAPEKLTGVQKSKELSLYECADSVPGGPEDEAGDGRVAAVESVDNDEEEAEEEDVDYRTTIMQQYFQ